MGNSPCKLLNLHTKLCERSQCHTNQSAFPKAILHKVLLFLIREGKLLMLLTINNQRVTVCFNKSLSLPPTCLIKRGKFPATKKKKFPREKGDFFFGKIVKLECKLLNGARKALWKKLISCQPKRFSQTNTSKRPSLTYW